MPAWVPTPGPQQEAMESNADILFYGGAAGGGKTDLAIGMAMTVHNRSIIYRRESKQILAINDRIAEIHKSRDGYNGQDKVWRLDGRQLELGGVQHAGDEKAFQGRAHDLKVFDEVTHFLESQFRFLCGWLRTTTKGIRERIICTGNPPTDPEGEWVVKFWGPWLDPSHKNPAKPGELRWYAMLDGVETELLSGDHFKHYNKQSKETEIIEPKSRTFIPSKVGDNPFLEGTDYKATLQALPEPLRSQMLHGDFSAGKEDNVWQVIPTEWVKKAQERWRPDCQHEMDALGMDVARGGKDQTILAPRHGNWFGELLKYPGSATPNGPIASSLAIAAVRDSAPIQIDIIGVGASAYDHMEGMGINVVAMDARNKSDARDKTTKLGFYNKRSEWWWKMREALDPEMGDRIQLPPGRSLFVDLCTPRWSIRPTGIQVESKEEIIKRIQRSPDEGEAVVYALPSNPKNNTGDTPINAQDISNPFEDYSNQTQAIGE